MDEKALSSALARRISSANHRAKARGIDPALYDFYGAGNWNDIKRALWIEVQSRQHAPQRIELTEIVPAGRIKIEATFSTGLPWIKLGRLSKNPSPTP